MGTPPVIFAKGPGLVLCSGGLSGRWSFKGGGGAWTAELKNARQLKAPPLLLSPKAAMLMSVTKHEEAAREDGLR